MPSYRPPPFLVGAGLLFWGWQTELMLPALLLALVLESARWVKIRWEFTDEDFNRIWLFCTFLFFSAAIFAFTSNEGPTDIRGFLQNPSVYTTRNAGTASARTAASLIRWLPMVFFPFLAAQNFSGHGGVPPETVSLLLRWRWRKMRKRGETMPHRPPINVSYIYFGLCLFSASIHPGENNSFFWGFCALLTWAFWALRSPRFQPVIWALTLGAAFVLGYFGQRSLSQLQHYLENLNPQFLAHSTRSGRRFDPSQSKTMIGQLGRIKLSSQIVIRLEPQPGSLPPTLLREASYRWFREQVWSSGSRGSRTEYEPIGEESNRTSWTLLPGKTNLAGATISCYLPGGNALLPLPTGCGRLENLSAYGVSKNPMGAVLVQGPGLVVFDALYGPGSTIDSPPTEDLRVPWSEEEALDQVIEERNLAGKPRNEVLRELTQFFNEKFTYSMWHDEPYYTRTNQTPLARFLLRSRRGHCEYFATAATLLLRKLDIPARYAIGYAVHEANSKNGYVVRQRDAHAWCLVWNEDKKIWQDYDPTPATWIKAEEAAGSPFEKMSDFWDNVRFQFSKFRWGQTHLRKYLLIGMSPILVVLLIQVLFRRRKRFRERLAAARPELWPGMDSEFYELERSLARRGVVRAQSETFSNWLQRACSDHRLASVGDRIRVLLHLHYRYRFDPQGVTQQDRETLREGSRACLQGLRSHKKF